MGLLSLAPDILVNIDRHRSSQSGMAITEIPSNIESRTC